MTTLSDNFKTMSKPLKKVKGFTLIELLIVVAIISILVSIGAVSFSRIQRQGRDAERKTDLREIESALELYYADKGEYPDGTFGGATVRIATSVNTYPWIPDLEPYMANGIPIDPTNCSNCADDAGGHFYLYEVYGNNRDHYHVMINLENNSDSDRRDVSDGVSKPNFSPCNEEPWGTWTFGAYKTFPNYDWCVSSPTTGYAP